MLTAALLAAAVTCTVPRTSSAAELSNVVVINKSSNRNEVHYVLQLDGSCEPAGSAPVHPYWQMLERGPSVTEPLQGREERYLGVVRQDVRPDAVLFSLGAMPSRVIEVRTSRTADGRCTTSTEMTIGGVAAHLAGIYVKQKLFGVDYVLLTGYAPGGAVVRERVSL